MKIETLKDLKDFLAPLNEEQLKQPAVLQVVDSHYETISSAEISDTPEILTEGGWLPKSESVEFDLDEVLDERPAGHVYLFNE